MDCVIISDLMDEISHALAYSTFVVVCSVCVVLSFAMIINLLVWAEARNTRGQQGGGNSVA